MKMKHLIPALALLVTGCGQPTYEGEQLFTEAQRFFEKYAELFSAPQVMETLAQARSDGDKAWQVASGLHALYSYRAGEMSSREAERLRLLSIAWYDHAVELGSPYAQLDICYSESLFRYEESLTPEQEKELADKAFKTLSAREPKSPPDARYLAICYLAGLGVAPDPEMSYTWFERYVQQLPISEERRQEELNEFRKDVDAAKASTDQPTTTPNN